jgi:acyl dehydratase
VSLLYAEDLTPGREVEFGSMTLSEQDIIDFARQWDPLRIHTDVAYAEEGPFGQVIASGLHTLCAFQRMMVDAFGYDIAHKAGHKLQMKFRRPVLAGTTLSARCRVEDITLRPDRGDAWMSMRSEVLDQDGNVVLEIEMLGVVLMRPA